MEGILGSNQTPKTIPAVETATLDHKLLELGVIQESISDLKEGIFLALGSFEDIFRRFEKQECLRGLPLSAD